jgi:hypothetical protein
LCKRERMIKKRIKRERERQERRSKRRRKKIPIGKRVRRTRRRRRRRKTGRRRRKVETLVHLVQEQVRAPPSSAFCVSICTSKASFVPVKQVN